MSRQHGRPKEGSLPLGPKARSAKGAQHRPGGHPCAPGERCTQEVIFEARLQIRVIPPSASGQRCAQHGFTLLELLIALTLMALMASVLFGSLRLAARSWDGGEAKVVQVAEMRQTESFLRAQITSALPKRMTKAVEFPLLFKGTSEELLYVAPLPERVPEGGVLFFRLAVVKDGEHGQLVLERMMPPPDLVELPAFEDAQRTLLAGRIAAIKFSYFGRDAGASETDGPTWRDQWDDAQRMPLLIRADVTPENGPTWPSLIAQPRRAPEAACQAWDPVRQRCGRA